MEYYGHRLIEDADGPRATSGQRGRRRQRFMKKSWMVDRVGFRVAGVLILGLLVAGLVTAPTVHAAPAGAITITGCALDKAITAANQGSTIGTGCIFSGAGAPYLFTLTGDLALVTNLPTVTSNIVVKTNGATYLIEQRNTDAEFVFRVGPAGNLTLSKIHVTGPGGNADGIEVDAGGALTLADSVLDNLIFGVVVTGTASIRNTTIAHTGLGVWARSGSTEIINSTISNNQGIGLYIDAAASLTLSFSTVAYNGGPGLDIVGRVVVDTSLFDQNSVNCQVRGGQLTSTGYNLEAIGDTCHFSAIGDLVGVPAIGVGGVNLDPELRPYTHALLIDSVAIDRVQVGTYGCVAGGSADGRGHVRAGQRVVGDQRGGLACDVGAYEFDSTQTLSAVTVTRLQAESTTVWAMPGLLAAACVTIGGWVALRRYRS